MPAKELTHTTIKNDKKEVTHYDIKADGIFIGKATKGDGGKFNFAPAEGAGKELKDVKTMRDLKVEANKNLPKAYLEANKAKAEAKPAKAKPTKDKAKPATEKTEEAERADIENVDGAGEAAAAEAAAGGESEEIDLD